MKKVIGPGSLLGIRPQQGTLVDDLVCDRHTHKIPTGQPLQAATPTVPTHSANLWSKRLIWGGWRDFSVLFAGSQSYYADSTRIHHSTASKSNGAQISKIVTILRLCGHPSRCHTHIPRKLHGPSGPQQRLIPLWYESHKQSRVTFIEVKQHGVPYQQWSSVDCSQNHQGSHVISSRGLTRGNFHQLKKSIPECQALVEMRHTQPPTPMQTDKSTAHGVVTNKIPSKRLNSMDMRLHLLQCR